MSCQWEKQWVSNRNFDVGAQSALALGDKDVEVNMLGTSQDVWQTTEINRRLSLHSLPIGFHEIVEHVIRDRCCSISHSQTVRVQEMSRRVAASGSDREITRSPVGAEDPLVGSAVPRWPRRRRFSLFGKSAPIARLLKVARFKNVSTRGTARVHGGTERAAPAISSQRPPEDAARPPIGKTATTKTIAIIQ